MATGQFDSPRLHYLYHPIDDTDKPLAYPARGLFLYADDNWFLEKIKAQPLSKSLFQDLFVSALLSPILLDFWCGGGSLAGAKQRQQYKKTVKFAKMAGCKKILNRL